MRRRTSGRGVDQIPPTMDLANSIKRKHVGMDDKSDETGGNACLWNTKRKESRLLFVTVCHDLDTPEEKK
jgi:hypothetical protein